MFKLLIILVILQSIRLHFTIPIGENESTTNQTENKNTIEEYINEELRRLQKFSEHLNNSFNHDVNPCDDFVGYVSGNLAEAPEFEENLDQKETQNIFDKYILLEHGDGGENSTTSEYNNLNEDELKARSFFYSCSTKLPYTFEGAVKSVKNILITIAEKMEENENDDKTRNNNEIFNNLILIDSKLNSYNLSSILNTELILSPKNNENNEQSKIIIKLSPKDGDKFSLFYTTATKSESDNKFNDKLMNAYEEMLKTRLTDKEKFIEEFKLLEEEFQNIWNVNYDDGGENNENSKEIDTELTLSQLKEKFPDINWEEFFKNSFDFNSSSINFHKTIIISHESIITKYFNVISSKIENKKQSLLKKYFLLRFLNELLKEYNLIYANRSLCYNRVYKLFKNVFVNLLLRYYINENDAENYLKVIENIFSLIEVDFNENLLKNSENSHYDEYRQFNGLITERAGDLNLSNNSGNDIYDNFYGNLNITEETYMLNLLNSINYNKIRIFENRNLIPYFDQTADDMITAIYNCHNKPMIFYEIYFGIPLYQIFFNTSDNNNFTKNYDSENEHCKKFETLKVEYKSIEYALHLMDYKDKISSKEPWSELSALRLKENEILKEHNLSRKKILFTGLVQSLLKKFTFTKVEMNEYILTFLANFMEFGEEYSCSVGTVLNPDVKCKL